ncbi:MAG TPA: glutamine synthetase family protein [Caulobacteraceae bacterium]|nr:glutamine synthetase family protein [Caulobacteraceae bacterium]
MGARRADSALKDWIAAHGIAEVECLLADQNGVARGKIISAADFVGHARTQSLRLASSALSITITGDYAAYKGDAILDPDLRLEPDPQSLAVLPGFEGTRAGVFCEPLTQAGEPWPSAPRNVLKALIRLYAGIGLRPVIAPEIEFYLLGEEGARPAPYGLEAMARRGSFFAAVERASAAAGIELAGALAECGPGQLEINLRHGDPVRRADQAVLFKRIVRHAARELGLAATFMAKPMGREASSGMHFHLSLVRAKGEANAFADARGADTDALRWFIGGLQAFLPEIAPLYAPHPNSYRRMRPRYSAPVTLAWGRDNRSCGLRIPLSDPANRRVEVRAPGADANPYLAMAAALAAGWLGMERRLEPGPEVKDAIAYGQKPEFPRTLDEGLARLATCQPICELLGDPFIGVFLAVKNAELHSFSDVITPWEREHLLDQV